MSVQPAAEPVAVYDIRTGLSLFLFVPIIVFAALSALSFGIGGPIYLGAIAVLWIIAVRFVAPRFEFYEDFVRCKKGFSKPHDIPYSQLSMHHLRNKAYRLRDKTLEPKGRSYSIQSDMTIKLLDIKLFAWLQNKGVRFD